MSPSGKFTVRTVISGDEAGPTRRLCVKMVVANTATRNEMIFQSGASDTQKWALAWAPTNSLILYSSDIGTSAYDIEDSKIIERPATPEEQEFARKAYEKKYGKRPRA